MTSTRQPDNEQHSALDPAQLGADQAPATRPEDDPRDMSTVMANATDYTDEIAPRVQDPAGEPADGNSTTSQGSDFDEQRRRGATGTGDNAGAVGRGMGMGRAGSNGDQDRGYEPSGHRGGLGTSGGREDLSDRKLDTDQNAFTGGYGGGNFVQNPDDEPLRQQIGMHSQNPTGQPDQATDEHRD